MEELLAIFCDVDDFCKDYAEYCKHHLLMDKEKIIPKTSMSLSEIMTIVIYFHLSNQRIFKWYYIKFVGTVLRPYFPRQVSYNRFVEIMKMSIVPLTLYLMKYRVGKCTGINFIGSTTLDVCDSHRLSSATINIEKYIKISYIYTVTFLTEISSCFTVSDLAVATIV